ncbi:nucleotidyltransferase family protein [Erythrobacter litoralis]|uniref:MobA-like NTP transferase domain-containing protein n=1 Tax=Erythrobacter litoralis (strain HTCC2594) TaxID=314225 RepID=Q2N7K7_ERYLH|nr:nucleotidyltransferase family protein [Erythrobacter litoralis]ABC64334.1 hypothetical protein ELI_11210 [Erythrobacter litoralis HTCC2594]
MASVPPVAVALLAAGLSHRFGVTDKLAAPFRGKPLGLHAAHTLAGLPFAHRWMIVRSAEQSVDDGFTGVINPDAAQGMGTSVALAARMAEEVEAEALLIALADMPLVPAVHFAELLERASPEAILASHNGTSPSPPALFGRKHLATLRKVSGDEGARMLLKSAEIVSCDPAWLVDIDTPEALQRHG